MWKIKIKEGDTFGYLTVIKRVDNAKNGHSRWLCKCKCGKETVVMSTHITGGKIVSCGCYWNEKKYTFRRTHGFAQKERLYTEWQSMKARCYSKTRAFYEYYGGRGIKVCDEWKQNYLAFREWSLKNGYKDNLTLDRIDVNGNYEPSNCRWVTMYEQSRNTRKNIFITYNGETRIMRDWARVFNISYYALGNRIRNGMKPEKALEEMLSLKGGADGEDSTRNPDDRS